MVSASAEHLTSWALYQSRKRVAITARCLLLAMSPGAVPIGVQRFESIGCSVETLGRQMFDGGDYLIMSLEPISKSSEEDNEASELDKAEEVLSVVLPADKDATLPLYPGEEALDEPAPHVTA